MITVADLNATPVRQVERATASALRERQDQAEGVAWAKENKRSYSAAAWKQRHRAERRYRAAQAVASALTEALITELARPSDLIVSRRKLEIILHDMSVGIRQDEANDATFRTEIYAGLIRHLRHRGWTVGQHNEVHTRHRCLSPDYIMAIRRPAG